MGVRPGFLLGLEGRGVRTEGVPVPASLEFEDLDDGVEVVASSGVDRYAGGLVDGHESIVFVDDADGTVRDGGFMAVELVRDVVSVLDYGFEG